MVDIRQILESEGLIKEPGKTGEPAHSCVR